MCVEVFYTVPEQSAKCSWVISLNEGGTDGIVLDESEDTDNYMVRTISGTEALPFIKSRSKPVFPPIAIVARVSGDVTTRVLVSKSGDLQQVRVVSGPPMLQQASIDAAKNWKFTPMTIGTRTVQYEVELVFTYALITSDPRMSIVRTVP
jgi:TonB family protein